MRFSFFPYNFILILLSWLPTRSNFVLKEILFFGFLKLIFSVSRFVIFAHKGLPLQIYRENIIDKNLYIINLFFTNIYDSMAK